MWEKTKFYWVPAVTFGFEKCSEILEHAASTFKLAQISNIRTVVTRKLNDKGIDI